MSKVARIREWHSEWLKSQGIEAPPTPESPHECVRKAGPQGLTLQEIQGLAAPGSLDALRDVRRDPRVAESRELRPNRAGRLQEQVVLRWQESKGKRDDYHS